MKYDLGWISAADVKTRRVKWLWPGRIPLEMFSLVASLQGSGKSLVMADIAARVTRGDRWPDSPADAPPQPAGTVLWVPSEETPENVIVPRMLAAGAVLGRAKFPPCCGPFEEGDTQPRAFGLAHGVAELGLLAGQLAASPAPVRLIVIDTLVDAMPGVDIYKEAEVRAALRPLVRLAADTGAAVVGVMHERKGASASAVGKVSGSMAFTSVARAGSAVVECKDGTKLRTFGVFKSNLGAFPEDVAFRFGKRTVVLGDGPQEESFVNWTAERPESSACEMMTDDSPRRLRAPKRTEAEDFLLDQLRGGPRLATEVAQAAEGRGIKDETLKNARQNLRVDSYLRDGNIGDPRMWKLPE